jgi:DNA polymerase-3 subunit epsilon
VNHVQLPRFAVIDLETSGVSTRRHRILQLGMVVVEPDGTLVDEWSTMVKLRWRFSRVGPTHVHGITRSMLRDAPGLDPVLDELGARWRGAVFTAHNARFDGGFLFRAARRRPVDDPVRAGLATRLCTLRMSRGLDPDRAQSHQLADVCQRYGIVIDRPHDALSDARATAQVLPHLLRAHGITAADELAPFYDRLSLAA